MSDAVLHPAADFEHGGLLPRAVLQTVPVAVVGREPGAVAGPQHLLAGVGDEHDLAREDINELVLASVPVALARPRAGRQAQQIDPELRQPGRVAEPGALARPARL